MLSIPALEYMLKCSCGVNDGSAHAHMFDEGTTPMLVHTSHQYPKGIMPCYTVLLSAGAIVHLTPAKVSEGHAT